MNGHVMELDEVLLNHVLHQKLTMEFVDQYIVPVQPEQQ